MSITGNTRYRRTVFGKIILQVEDRRRCQNPHFPPPPPGSNEDSLMETFWRDAGWEDTLALEKLTPFVGSAR